jgi:hypothetical protein
MMNKRWKACCSFSVTLGLLQTKIRVAKSDGIHPVSNDHCFQDEQFDGIHPVSNDHYFSMISPSTSGMLLQTKSAGSGSFVVSLQARNQFSKTSTEMELVR